MEQLRASWGMSCRQMYEEGGHCTLTHISASNLNSWNERIMESNKRIQKCARKDRIVVRTVCAYALVQYRTWLHF